jgi:hypothetical protein
MHHDDIVFFQKELTRLADATERVANCLEALSVDVSIAGPVRVVPK